VHQTVFLTISRLASQLVRLAYSQLSTQPNSLSGS